MKAVRSRAARRKWAIEIGQQWSKRLRYNQSRRALISFHDNEWQTAGKDSSKIERNATNNTSEKPVWTRVTCDKDPLEPWKYGLIELFFVFTILLGIWQLSFLISEELIWTFLQNWKQTTNNEKINDCLDFYLHYFRLMPTILHIFKFIEE